MIMFACAASVGVPCVLPRLVGQSKAFFASCKRATDALCKRAALSTKYSDVVPNDDGANGKDNRNKDRGGETRPVPERGGGGDDAR